MFELSLTDEERQVLIEILESTVSDLGMEIADTEARDFRDKLKAKKAVASKLLERCAQRAVEPAPGP
ncbi:MAG: hypothetical protein ACE5I7_14080 [Candidatus Binatia bacterium]